MNLKNASIALFVLLFTASVQAQMYTANLSGAQEVPAVSTNATGWARVVLNESAGTISFTVSFSGLSSNQTAAHIHGAAPIGVNAGVLISLGVVGGTSGTLTGTTAITPTQIANLRANQTYVNVHTVNNAGGEIRGQLSVARPIDRDGDGRTDLSILRFPNIAPPGQALITWYGLNSSAGAQVQGPFGDANTDFPMPGDYDGDGKADIAVFRANATGQQSVFFIFRTSDSTYQAVAFGLGGDQPVARDYDGDGKTDPAVFRTGAVAGAQANWWIRLSTTNSDRVVPFGTTGNGTTSFDTPVPGDYDGDGKFDVAVYRFGLSPANNFIILRSSDGGVLFQPFGNFNTDYIVPADYDGDGKFDLAAARTGATGTSPMVWWILRSSTGTTLTQPFGISSDRPVQGDYDGDGRTDIAIYRPAATAAGQSNYWILRSFSGTAQVTPWGLGADFSENTYDSR